MKTFTTLAFAGLIALASATGTVCPDPNGFYCSGGTNITACSDGAIYTTHDCKALLLDDYPSGTTGAYCYTPGLNLAACGKACLIYGGTGNLGGGPPQDQPGCVYISSTTLLVPTGTSSATKSSATLTSSSSSSYPYSTAPTSSAASTSSSKAVSYTTIVYDHTTVTVPCTNSNSPVSTAPVAVTTITVTAQCPTASGLFSSVASRVSSTKAVNGTATGSAKPSAFTGGAVAVRAGSGVAAAVGVVLVGLL